MRRSLPCAALCLAGLAPAAAQSVSILAWDNTPYPSLPAGTWLTLLSSGVVPSTAPDGTVAFTGLLAGAGSGNVACIATPAGPHIVAHEGDPAPGAPDLHLGSTTGVIALSAGRAALTVQLLTSANASAGTGMYLADDSGLHPLVLSNQPAAGVPGYVFIDPSNLAFAAATGTFFSNVGPNTSSPIYGGLWSGAPGALGLLALVGDPAAGFPVGRQYLLLGTFPAINASGTALFTATVGPVATQTVTVYTGTPGSLSTIYRSGDPAPGIPGGVFCAGSGGPSVVPAINSAGQAVFGAWVCDGTSTRRSLWFSSGTALLPVMLQGDPAPGTGAFFGLPAASGLSSATPVLNDSGMVAFVATLTGPGVTPNNNTAIFAGAPGSLRLIARTGDPAPGFPAGATILAFASTGSPGHTFALNARGQIVIPAQVSGGSPGGVALYAAQPGGLTRLLYTGGPISPGSADTVSAISLIPAVSNAPSGRASCLDDAGRLAMRLRVSILFGGVHDAVAILQLPDPCYPNCDESTAPPILNIADFTCFLNRFAAQDPRANCDLSTALPQLNISDFSCFLNRFAAGCS
jgi:hypothetical protein